MDSPVILDSATKFGRGLDLDRDDFPGFPFDDDGGFGRRGDIRSHLDDLAARHPEFADHLLGPPWADVPFGGGGSLHRNRNRRSSNDRPANNHHQPDEDTRSQNSGGSGASSHSSSEPEANITINNESKNQANKNQGLRNHTLDIGQHQHNMENPQQQRNVRSMSAPPENRNNINDPSGRFVSKVDINTQPNQTASAQNNQSQPQQQQQQQTQRENSPGPQHQQPKPQAQSQQGNVRHIPIFVEGRSEPVIPKDTEHRGGGASSVPHPPPPPPSMDETDFGMPRRQQSPPHFHRPSHFSQQHFNKHPPTSGWASSFQDPFFEHTTSQWPPRHRDSPFGSFRHTDKPSWAQQQQHHQQQQEPPQMRRQQPQQQQQPSQNDIHHHQQQQQQHHEAPPKPKQQVQPKDPLEKVALVQKEVDALTEQVKQYTGNSRQDKQYMYLDEMLTRELIKLDDIETEGKENVRQARKQAIKSIQESISLLESKAPLPGQETNNQSSGDDAAQPMEGVNGTDEKPAESMDTNEPPATEEQTQQQQQKAIPLPAPTSPTLKAAQEPQQPKEEKSTKTKKSAKEKKEQPTEANKLDSQKVEAPGTKQAEPAVAAADTPAPANATSPQESAVKAEESKPSQEPMDSSSSNGNSNEVAVPAAQQDVEMRQPSPAKEVSSEAQDKDKKDAKPDKAPNDTQPDETATATTATTTNTTTTTIATANNNNNNNNNTTDKPKKEPPPVPAKPGKSPKKAKKTPKKQPEPVSETAIPMPAPGQ